MIFYYFLFILFYLFRYKIHLLLLRYRFRPITIVYNNGVIAITGAENCRMLVFSVTSLSFSENIWTKIFLGAYVVFKFYGRRFSLYKYVST